MFNLALVKAILKISQKQTINFNFAKRLNEIYPISHSYVEKHYT
jgi:hypothetical protein